MADTIYPANESGVQDLGHRHFVAPLDGAWRIWHDCPAQEHVSWGWFGTRDDGQKSGHEVYVIGSMLWKVGGSILCPACGDHGFIGGFKWVPA